MSVNAYKKTSINTSSAKGLLSLTFGILLTSLEGAKLSISTGNISLEAKHSMIAVEALVELRSSLDMSYDISSDLSSLYSYCIAKVEECSFTKSTSGVEECSALMSKISHSFDSI